MQKKNLRNTKSTTYMYYSENLYLSPNSLDEKPYPLQGGSITVGLKLVRQSQIVQSVMQDCKYVLSYLLPVCNLLGQGQLLFVKTVLNFTVVFYVEFRSF